MPKEIKVLSSYYQIVENMVTFVTRSSECYAGRKVHKVIFKLLYFIHKNHLSFEADKSLN